MYAGLHVKCLLFWLDFKENRNVSENFNKNTEFEKKKNSRKSVRRQLTVALSKLLC
jgi:hypothetical protein